jgi:glycine/D-amino acid oxidase-like deaminating enzyme
MDEALRLEHAMFATVDEVKHVTEYEGIECGFQKGGVISLARNEPQAKRQIDAIQVARSRGFADEVIRLLEPEEARTQLNATNIRSGLFFSPSATIDPGRLVRGLAKAVESRGGKIVEGTTVQSIEEKKVCTSHGEVTAEVVIQATEAFTRDLKGKKLDLLPVYSRMIATEPLSDSLMSEIGLEGRPTFNDGRYIVIYGQRTEDNRIAFGGQGNPPYLFGSKIDSAIEGNEISHEEVWRNLIDLLPQLRDVAITHRWGGVLAIPRNWLPGIRFEKTSGLGFLGGYVGEGVAAANLAGRTMADLVLGLETDLVSLPWVGVHARRWEPEPLRWLGVRASRRFMGSADISETRTGKTGWLAMKAAHLLRGD